MRQKQVSPGVRSIGFQRPRYGFSVFSLLRKKVFRHLFATLIIVILSGGMLMGLKLSDNSKEVYAATSSNINFQARLLNSAGNTVPDGYYNLEFNLYDQSSGGTPDWTETYSGGNRARVVNGYMSVYLGSLTAFPSTIDWDQEQWITINVGGSGGSPSWDGEMTPRIKLTATPYAFSAGQAKRLIDEQLSGTGTLEWLTLSQNRTISLPDASGTVLLNSTGFANNGNSFGGTATLGTNDANDLVLETGGAEGLRIDQDGDVSIGTGADGVEALDVNGGLRLGNTTNTNAGTIRWTGTDFEGYDGTQWKSLTLGSMEGATASFVSGRANVAANLTGATVETLVFTSATGVSNTAGVTGFTAPADGSFRTCLIKNNANITAGTLDLRWQVNGASVGAAACPMDSTTNRQSASALASGTVSFDAGDTIGIAFDTVGLAPTTNDFTVYWTVEYTTGGSTGASFLQGGNNFGNTAILGTLDNEGLSFITNGTEKASISSAGLFSILTGLSVDGGIDNNSDGITEAGAISGVTTLDASGLITADGGLTVGVGDTFTVNGEGFTDLTGNGLVLSGGGLTVNQDNAFTWTADHTFNLNDTEDLEVNSTISGTNSGQGQIISITNSSSSGNQYGLYVDNLASSGTTEALVVLDNSDADTAVISAIQLINGGGGFTNLFDIAGTLIDIGEFTVLDGGLSESEITGEVESVTAGNGLSGGGTDGALTLDIGAGDGITVNADDIAIRLDTTAADGVTSSSISGLEFVSGELSLIRGCANGQVLQWNNSAFTWDCGTGDLDSAYALDADKVLNVNNAAGLAFDLTSTGALTMEDGGTAIATFDSNGGITFAPTTGENFTVNFAGDGFLDINAVTYLNGIGAIDVVRTGNFTGIAGQTANELRIAPGLILTEPGSGVFSWNGANIDMSGISVTAGAGTSVVNGLRIAGVSDADVGTSNGLLIDNLTSTASNEYAINIGTGWDANINLQDTNAIIRMGATDNTGIISITDSAATPNTLVRIQDHATNFGASVEAGAFIDYNSMYSDEFFKDRTQVAADGNQNWGDNTEWTTGETGVCTWDGLPDAINGITSISATSTADYCSLYHSDLGAATTNNWLDADNLPTIVMKVRPSVAGAGVPDTDHQFFAGMASGFGDAAPASGAPTNGIYFTNASDSAGTTGTSNWYAKTDNGAAVTNTACGVAVSEANYALLVIKVMSTSLVKFYIDADVSNGISLTECGTGNTTNINTAGMTSFLKADWDANANASTLDVDFYRVWQDDNVQSPEPGPATISEIGLEGEDTLGTGADGPPPLNLLSSDSEMFGSGIDFFNANNEQITGLRPESDTGSLGVDDPRGIMNFYSTKAINEIAQFIDSEGNASFSSLKVDGVIEAGTIRADRIEGLDYLGRIDDIEERLSTIEENSPSSVNGNVENLETKNISTGKLKASDETDLQKLNVGLDLIAKGSTVFEGQTSFKETAWFEKDIFGTANIDIDGDTNLQKLTVNLDLISKGALLVDGKATFKEAVRFEKDVSVVGNLSVEGQLKVGKDTAGIAKIEQGKTKVKVKFRDKQNEVPLISLTLGDGKFGQYSYRKVDKEGFEIVIPEPASESMNFTWIAIQRYNDED